MKLFSYVVLTVVAVVVITGFYLIGSPAKERMRKFDEKRIRDLQSLQFEIVDYWRNKTELPKELSVLNNDLRGYRIPTDPNTRKPYEYIILGSERFSLCAEFDLKNDDANIRNVPVAAKCVDGAKCVIPPRELNGIWAHEKGRSCFEREIDKEIYKPYPPLQQ